MPYPPLHPGTVAEIVCRYRRGESTPQIARALHLANSTVVSTLEREGVERRSRRDAWKVWMEVYLGPRCRCCGIILAKAGCGHHDGVCDDCWEGAAKRAGEWGCGIREAMERWIEEGRRAERGETELGEWRGNIKRRAE